MKQLIDKRTPLPKSYEDWVKQGNKVVSTRERKSLRDITGPVTPKTTVNKGTNDKKEK